MAINDIDRGGLHWKGKLAPHVWFANFYSNPFILFVGYYSFLLAARYRKNFPLSIRSYTWYLNLVPRILVTYPLSIAQKFGSMQL